MVKRSEIHIALQFNRKLLIIVENVKNTKEHFILHDMKKQEEIEYKYIWWYRVLKINIHMKPELFLLGLLDTQKEAHRWLV